MFHFFRIWTSETPQPIPNDIWQSLMLHLVNITAYAKFYQNIPNGLRVIDIFYEQAGVKIFTNRPASKSSQTVRWQNQMFDYRHSTFSWLSRDVQCFFKPWKYSESWAHLSRMWVYRKARHPSSFSIFKRHQKHGLRLIVPLVSFGTSWPNN